MQHPVFFTFLSGFVYGFSYQIHIFYYWDKYGFNFALKTVSISLLISKLSQFFIIYSLDYM